MTSLDQLTNLPQREELESQISILMTDSRPLVLAVIDIDYFLQLNKTYGRDTGDAVLQKIARVLRENMPAETLVARVSGDEFAVLFPDENVENAFVMLEEVRKLVADAEWSYPVNEQTQSLRITFSTGLAAITRDSRPQTLDELFRQADDALHRGKQMGRNRVSLPREEKMVLKSNYYTPGQLERLAKLAAQLERTEAALLREALEHLLRRYAR